MNHQQVPYKEFGLTAKEYRHACDRFINPLDCTCNGCKSPIHLDLFVSEDESWCRVLYLDGDDGQALFKYDDEIPCYSGSGFQMQLLNCQYCEIPHAHMKQIIEIFEAFEEECYPPSTPRGLEIVS
jgi:hypothetical protein